MDTVRTFSRFLLALLIRVIVAVLTGTLLLTAVYCIPTDRMDANLGDSVEVFQKEGTMPDPGTPYSCVITSDIAASLNLGPGDTFSMDELQGTLREVLFS